MELSDYSGGPYESEEPNCIISLRKGNSTVLISFRSPRMNPKESCRSMVHFGEMLRIKPFGQSLISFPRSCMAICLFNFDRGSLKQIGHFQVWLLEVFQVRQCFSRVLSLPRAVLVSP